MYVPMPQAKSQDTFIHTPRKLINKQASDEHKEYICFLFGIKCFFQWYWSNNTCLL